MKRFFTFFTIAAALLAVSCAKEQEGPSAGKAMVTYTIDGPVQVATKAMGIIGSEYTLYYEVRLWDGSALGDALTGEGLSGHKDIAADAWPASVSFDLARGKQYKILFWAQSKTAPEGLYDASNLAAIAIDYSKMAASEEKCDAFYGSDVITPAGATAASATLYRPFALVNLGTSDAAQFHTASGGCTVGDVKVTINGSLANSFNVATGEPGAGVATNFAPNAAPIDAYDAKTLVVGETSFNYLSAVYVLPAGASDVIEVAYDIKDNASAAITSLTVSNVPVHANFRTNITGKLLTGTTTYEISVDQDFAGNTNKEATPTFSSIAALNTFFASNLATGPNDPDNGDIYPETVTVTAIPDGDATTITLPNDTLSVAINILASYSAEEGLTIAYPTAEGAKHSNKVFFNMSGLSKLTANLPDTHLEVVSGSSIDLSDVHTSASTFVVQKNARVGVLNIKQGNAKIAGSIDSLKVNQNAKADADNNPVQVFLEKDSAVEKIILNAKTDVVVEQPKDQIEVEATEKKVAVYVNEGADNSTAKAQNGGVIYVEANVPCTVTADGTSTAEEGAVSSTVIINEGAAGSEVNATNGGAINLEANADCSASADGVAEGPGSEPDIPSTINVTEVKDENIVIDANTSEGGEIDTTPETSGAVKYFVAQIVGGDKYESLYDAVAAAEAGAKVEMINNSTETKGFTLTKSLTIDLCEFTVTYDSSAGTEQFPNTRAIKIGGSDEISVTIENGTIAIQNNIYGPFRFENSNADIVLNDLILNNGMAYGLGIKLVSAKSLSMEGCSVSSNIGGGLEQNYACPVTISDCEFEQTELDTQHPWISSAVSVCYNGVINVDSGSYSGHTAAFVFSSGGTINISGGTFVGRDAAINVENNTWEPGYAASSVVNVTGGTFTGALKVSGWGGAGTSPVSALNISGGTFTAEPGNLFHTNPGTISISGGTFSEDPSAYVDLNDYKVEENAGMYTVSPIPVFHITNEEELQQAFDEGHVKMLLENDIDVGNPHTLTLNSGKTANLIMPYCINNLSNLSFVINGNLNITGCGEIWNGENLTVSGTGKIDIASTISGSDEFGPLSYEGFFDNSKAMVMENVTITSDVVPFTAIANSSNGTLSMTNVKMDIEDRGIFSNGGGNVTLNSVDFECFYRACFRSQFSENAEVTVTDSKLLSHSYYWNEYNGTVGGAYNQTFQMLGGGHATITNTEIGGVHGAISISKSNNVPSSATINSGRFYTFNPEAPTVKEQVYGAIYLYYSSVIINGGEFIAGGGYPSLRFYGGNAEIHGGKFGVGSYNMTPIEYLDAYTLSVTGGWFAKKIGDQYLASGYQWAESGDTTYPWAVVAAD